MAHISILVTVYRTLLVHRFYAGSLCNQENIQCSPILSNIVYYNQVKTVQGFKLEIVNFIGNYLIKMKLICSYDVLINK